MSDDKREAPQDIAAEQAVLGCLFLNSAALPVVRRILSSPLMFSTREYGMIFRSMCKIADRREPVDQVTVGTELNRLNYLEKVGGVAVFDKLEVSWVPPAIVEHYAKIIREAYAFREVINAGHQIVELGYSNPEEPEEMFRAAKLAITAACGAAEYSDGALSLEDCGGLVWDHLEGGDSDNKPASYLPLGMHDLEIPRGIVTTLGGRTTNGKTALILNWELHLARQGYKVLHVSLEDNATRYGIRMAANLAQVENTKISKRLTNNEESQRVLDAINEMKDIPISVHAKKGATIGYITSYAAAHQATKGLDLIVVDFLQLVRAKRGQSAYDKVTEAMEELVILAEELDIAVIAVSQVGRPQDKGNVPKPPTMFDMKESGQVENLSKVIFVVHRPSVYDKNVDPTELLLKAVKVSEGSTGEWMLRGYMPHMKVGELENRPDDDNRGDY